MEDDQGSATDPGPRSRSAETSPGATYPKHRLLGSFRLVQYPFKVSPGSAENQALAFTFVVSWSGQNLVNAHGRTIA